MKRSKMTFRPTVELLNLETSMSGFSHDQSRRDNRIKRRGDEGHGRTSDRGVFSASGTNCTISRRAPNGTQGCSGDGWVARNRLVSVGGPLSVVNVPGTPTGPAPLDHRPPVGG